MRKRHSSAAMYLLEFVIVLLVFSIASTITVQLFVKGHTLSDDANEANYAVAVAQSNLETVFAFNGNKEALSTHFNLDIENTTFTVYYDEHWQPVEDQSITKQYAKVSMTQKDEMLYCKVEVLQDEKELFALEGKKYLSTNVNRMENR